MLAIVLRTIAPSDPILECWNANHTIERSSRMTPEEALRLLDSLLQGHKLKDLQEAIFCHTWQGWTYPEIAKHTGYDTSHIRDVGYELWQQLSQLLGERITKKNVHGVLRRLQHRQIAAPQLPDEGEHPIKEPLVAVSAEGRSPHWHHWGDAIDVSIFYGRTQELRTLNQWIKQDRCRLVALLGMGGMGKTTLAAKLANDLHDEFDILIWQSFRNAPPVEAVLPHLLQILSGQPSVPTDSIAVQLSQILEHLRTTRCLLVFDNVETILATAADPASPTAGQFRAGYEAYGELCKRIGTERHRSCLVLTSREKLQLLSPIEGDTLPVRSLGLSGLGSADVRSIVAANESYATSEAEWQQLTDCYSGNPLALKIVSTTVRDLFDGNVPEFLDQRAIVFGDISALLDEQFCRLSVIEKQVMYGLAISREWASLSQLRTDLIASAAQSELLEALLSLRRRSLVEQNVGLFTLQPVVMEYVTDQLIAQIGEELATLELDLFLSHALMKAQAKDYIRESQIRLILSPIATQLTQRCHSIGGVIDHLDRLRDKLQAEHAITTGYGGGNLINLLRHLNVDLSGYDFSRLRIWQAHLQGAELYRVNFAQADLAACSFTQTFGSILSVAFSPNGELLATGGVNQDVCLWQVASGQQLLMCKGHANWVLSVAFDPQGQWLASAGEDRTIRLWDVSTGVCLKVLQGHTDYVHSVAFSAVSANGVASSVLLASGSLDKTIKLWDVEAGQCLRTLQGHTSWVEQVAFSGNGQRLVSGGGDRTIKLWDVSTGECLTTLQGHEGQVSSVAFSPDDSRIASGSGDRTIKLWDASTGQCLTTLQGHKGQVWSVAFTANGQLASGSHDETIKLWDVSTGQCDHTLQGHSSQVRSVAFRPDGEILASGSGDQTIRLWQVNTAECIKVFQGYSSQIWSVAFHPEGVAIASGSHDQTVRIWNTRTGVCLNTLRGHSSWVRSVAFSPDGKLLASSSGDQTIKLWNVNTGQCLRTLRGHNSWIRSIAFSPMGDWLASSSHDQTVRLWNLGTGAIERVLPTRTVWTRAIAFSPDGAGLVTCLDQTRMTLWQVNSGKQRQIFEGHTAQIWSATFSPDGKTLATGSSDQTIKLWDVATGKCLHTLHGHVGNVWSVAFTGNGTLLVSGGDDTVIRLWQLQTGEVIRLAGHDRPVQSVVCSGDGQTIATGSEDETVRIWHLPTGECLQTLRADRPYEGMNITQVTGLSDIQKVTLCALGAYEEG